MGTFLAQAERQKATDTPSGGLLDKGCCLWDTQTCRERRGGEGSADMVPWKGNIDASHRLVLSRVSSEESPGWWRTFSLDNLPLSVLQQNAGPRTLLFVAGVKSSLPLWAPYFPATWTQHREHWLLVREVPLQAVAASVPGLCRFLPLLSNPPRTFL